MKVQNKIHSHKHYTEQITVLLSLLCAVHCVAVPIFVVFLPLAAVYLENYHWVEYLMIASVFILGTSSILHGYKYHHKNKIPSYVFFGGLILLCSSSILSLGFHIHNSSEHLLSGIGGIACGFGQLYNLKLSR